MNESHSSEHSDRDSEAPRRSFLMRFTTGLLAASLGLLPTLFGFLFFLDPLLRRRGAGSTSGEEQSHRDSEGFIKLDAKVDALPDNGAPMSFKVVDDKVDAWNKFTGVEVGTVWLRKKPDGTVIAFNTICPHLGCAVDYRSGKRDFFCPCHTSAFNLDGVKQNQIPPRGMDQLSTKLKAETGDAIWVKYENFLAGRKEKVPVNG
ncbi:MAG: Rieske 2Fe-2S domain-containing protein [Pirellulaceae bacterium]|nr:Rieske 2Fe-2S domain-containing protein [Pirellulaceae bacterium]